MSTPTATDLLVETGHLGDKAAVVELAQRLATALADVERLREDLEESERVEKLYYSQLCKTQIALDMRCVDNPKQVGCADTLFDVADAAIKLRQRAEAAEAKTNELSERVTHYMTKLAEAQQREAWWRELCEQSTGDFSSLRASELRRLLGLENS